MSVFISHAHVDRGIAEGLKALFDAITSHSVAVWYSSDTRPGRGLEPGDWRRQIWERIADAKAILVLLSPQSNERPWLVWESGFAEGKDKKVMPVLFWLKSERVHSVFRDRQTYRGDRAEQVSQLCGKVIHLISGQAPSPQAVAAWKPLILGFLEAVETERQSSDERTLFHDHFHNQDTSEKMEGRWLARWTGIDGDGRETTFEADSLRVWTDETRIRLVGDGAKGKPYPMEGVVSSLGQVALSYWSEGDTAICGTVLLRPAGAGIGSRLTGTWQGFTAKDLASDLRYVRGRVAMAKDAGDGRAEEFIDQVLAAPFDWLQ